MKIYSNILILLGLILGLVFSCQEASAAGRNIFDAFMSEDSLSDEMRGMAVRYRQEGLQAQQSGDIRAAISLYQKAVGLDPGYATAYNDLGILYESIGKDERARENYLKAISADPKYPNSYANLALYYEGKKDFTNAILFWVKRVMVGEIGDPWTEVAMNRLEQINHLYPEAFDQVDRAYVDGLHALGVYPGMEYQSLSKVSLFDPTSGSHLIHVDPKIESLKYVERAKESFTAGEYAVALKQITIAEYLDPSNSEIKYLADQIRDALLR